MSVLLLARKVWWVSHFVSVFVADVSNVSHWAEIARTKNVRLENLST